MLDSKVVLPYTDDEGNIYGETIQATKEGDYYRIKSIPLYASKIALYDLIAVCRRKGVLYFHKIISLSGTGLTRVNGNSGGPTGKLVYPTNNPPFPPLRDTPTPRRPNPTTQ